MHQKIALLLAGLCLLTSNASAQTESFFLKNGLEVIVIPNKRVPAVNHTLWYKVGAADDPRGKSGLAHYHEHVMFLGTQKYKSGEYSNIIARNGGEQNAFTGHDATAYFINIAKEYLPLAMEMEADRMNSLTASDEAMEKEKQVIIEERRLRIDNNPDALLSEQANAALWRNHPYHAPVIGWQHEMYGLTKQDVMDFHKKYYHPNNAILIVSGDVTTEEVKKLAQKYYGHLKSAHISERVWTDEPPHIAARRLVMHNQHISQPELLRIYATASIGHGNKEDMIPLFIASHILGGGKTSRLYKSLVTEQKLAASVNVNYNGLSRGPGTFYIELVPENNIDPARLEEETDKQLTEFLTKGINQEELTRAKTLLKAETIFARDGLSGIANIMGWLRMAGLDKDYFSRWPSLIEPVTAEAVLAATKNHLKIEHSVTSLLLPPKTNEEKK